MSDVVFDRAPASCSSRCQMCPPAWNQIRVTRHVRDASGARNTWSTFRQSCEAQINKFWNGRIGKHSACSCVGVCVSYVRVLQVWVRVCVCIGIREGVFTQQKQLCQQRKEQSILKPLSILCSTAARGISAERAGDCRLELCSISYQLIVLAITTIICTHTYSRTHKHTHT